jgi:hypothetical protein
VSHIHTVAIIDDWGTFVDFFPQALTLFFVLYAETLFSHGLSPLDRGGLFPSHSGILDPLSGGSVAAGPPKPLPPSGPSVLRPGGLYYPPPDPPQAHQPPPPPSSTADFYRPFKINGESVSSASTGAAGPADGFGGFRRQTLGATVVKEERHRDLSAANHAMLEQARKYESSLAAGCHTGKPHLLPHGIPALA